MKALVTQPAAEGFASFNLRGWQQFADVRIDFDARATIITGVNGTGKSTILRLLGSHFEWERVFYGVPAEGGPINGTWTKPVYTDPDMDGWQKIGALTYYGRAEESPMSIRQADSGRGYNIFFFNRMELPGVYIPPQRNQTAYANIAEFGTAFPDARSVLVSYIQAVRGREENSPLTGSPFQTFKRSLLAAANFGGRNEFVEGQEVARQSWAGYNDLLRMLFPASLGFRRLFVEVPKLSWTPAQASTCSTSSQGA